MIPGDESANYEAFRDAMQGVIVQRLLPSERRQSRHKRIKGRRNDVEPVSHTIDLTEHISELSDFIEVCCSCQVQRYNRLRF